MRRSTSDIQKRRKLDVQTPVHGRGKGLKGDCKTELRRNHDMPGTTSGVSFRGGRRKGPQPKCSFFWIAFLEWWSGTFF